MSTIKLKLIIPLLLLASNISAQDSLNLSLKECRDMASLNSEKIKIADENIANANGMRISARSNWFPNISATAVANYSKYEIQEEIYLPTTVLNPTTGEYVPNVVMNPSTGEAVLGPDGNPIFNSYAFSPLDLTVYGVMAGVNAQQALYAGGKIMASNKMAKIGEKMAAANKELKQTDLIFLTDQYYYQYLSVKEKVKLANEYQDLLKELVKTVNDSYEMGMINQNKLLKVQVKYNEACLQVQRAETGLKLSQMALCQVIGVDLRTPLIINDSINSHELLSNSTEDLKANQRIEYQLLEDQVKLAKQNINLVRGDYLPSASLSVGYSYLIVALDDRENFEQNGFNAMLSVNIPITTFGEGIGKIKSAKAKCNIKQLELEEKQDLLQLEIEQAKLTYTDAYTRVEMSQLSLKQAKENMRISGDNYRLSMETIVNLLEAKAEWQQAYSNRIDALTSLKISESNLLRVSNQLK